MTPLLVTTHHQPSSLHKQKSESLCKYLLHQRIDSQSASQKLLHEIRWEWHYFWRPNISRVETLKWSVVTNRRVRSCNYIKVKQKQFQKLFKQWFKYSGICLKRHAFWSCRTFTEYSDMINMRDIYFLYCSLLWQRISSAKYWIMLFCSSSSSLIMHASQTFSGKSLMQNQT